MLLELKMLLPPAKKQNTLACIREIQVHKDWNKVYSQKGLTAMIVIATKADKQFKQTGVVPRWLYHTNTKSTLKIS